MDNGERGMIPVAVTIIMTEKVLGKPGIELASSCSQANWAMGPCSIFFVTSNFSFSHNVFSSGKRGYYACLMNDKKQVITLQLSEYYSYFFHDDFNYSKVSKVQGC